MYDCKILADSVSLQGNRLTTFQVTYPRMIHSEFLTHGMLVRNSESSRARPLKKNIVDVEQAPFIPEAFGKNQSGMQFDELLAHDANAEARAAWKFASEDMVSAANALAELEVHKSYANRVLEPFKYHTAIYSGTDWSNFFALRTHPDAQAEFRIIAQMMREAYDSNTPRSMTSSEWHLPLVLDDEINDEALRYSDPWVDWDFWRQVSIGRCARVSYLTHNGNRDTDADVQLYAHLLSSGHMSPFGHVARPFTANEWAIIDRTQGDLTRHYSDSDSSPFFVARLQRNLEYCAHYRGWWQARADIPNEHDFGLVLADKELQNG